MPKKPTFVDLYSLPENKRCQVIGEEVMKGQIVHVVVEDDGKKADRYVKKVRNRQPKAVELSRFYQADLPGMIVIRFGLAESKN